MNNNEKDAIIYEASIRYLVEKSNKRAWTVAIVSAFIALVSIVAIMLFAFLGLLVWHSYDLFSFNTTNQFAYESIKVSLIFDFVFVFLSFFSYLWVDDIQAKIEKKKIIDNSLDWFWKEV